MSANAAGGGSNGDPQGPVVGGLRLHPNLDDLEPGILIRGMDGRLYWISEKILQTGIGEGGCLLPVDDQPLSEKGVTPENREVRAILQKRLDALPPVVNIQNAIRGYLRVPSPGSTASGGPIQPRGGRVADDALSRLVIYIQRATGVEPPKEPPDAGTPPTK